MAENQIPAFAKDMVTDLCKIANCTFGDFSAWVEDAEVVQALRLWKSRELDNNVAYVESRARIGRKALVKVRDENAELLTDFFTCPKHDAKSRQAVLKKKDPREFLWLDDVVKLFDGASMPVPNDETTHNIRIRYKFAYGLLLLALYDLERHHEGYFQRKLKGAIVAEAFKSYLRVWLKEEQVVKAQHKRTIRGSGGRKKREQQKLRAEAETDLRAQISGYDDIITRLTDQIDNLDLQREGAMTDRDKAVSALERMYGAQD